MQSKRQHLIVGAEGLVGGELLRRWKSLDVDVLGTTRRENAGDRGLLYLDLCDDPSYWDLPWDRIDSAVLSAGIIKVEECQADPIGTADVNVAGMLALAERLLEHGIFVVYLSSGRVFDGSRPFEHCDSPVSPTTEYGKQKVHVENFLLGSGADVAVVRPTKFYGQRAPLLDAWAAELQAGKRITPFVGAVFAPLPANFLAAGIDTIVKQRMTGISQLSPVAESNFVDAANRIAARLGLPPNRVLPTHPADEAWRSLIFPPHTTLAPTAPSFAFDSPDAYLDTLIDRSCSIAKADASDDFESPLAQDHAAA